MAKATRDAYGEELARLVKENERIVVLDADLAGSTKSALAGKAAPERFFDMGIAEADMIGTAAGLAASGYIPFASSFAMFATGRAYEQIRNSVAYPQLNVKICGSHSGISVGEDGVSHQAIEDISLMRTIPGMEVFVPCDAAETKAVVRYAAASGRPCYIRTGRSKVEEVYSEEADLDIRRIGVLRSGKDAVLFACGLMVQAALSAADILQGEGIEITVADVCTIKPADTETIAGLLQVHEHVFTAEEHNIIGGLGSLICETAAASCPRRVVRLGMQDCFAESGKASDLLAKYGLDGPSVAAAIRRELQG